MVHTEYSLVQREFESHLALRGVILNIYIYIRNTGSLGEGIPPREAFFKIKDKTSGILMDFYSTYSSKY